LSLSYINSTVVVFQTEKIKIMEKSIQVNIKLSKLKLLQNEKKQSEANLRLQQRTSKCMDTMNQAILHPVST
jgi:hypothetical protein